MRGRWKLMSTDRSHRGSAQPVLSLSFKLVAMIRGADPRTSSGPAALDAAHTGRTHDRTRLGFAHPLLFPLRGGGRPHMTAKGDVIARSEATKQSRAFRTQPE